MLTLLQRLKPIRGTIRIVSVDPIKLKELPPTQTPTDRIQFKGINTPGFEVVANNERYKIVLTTVEPTIDGSCYQLEVYDNTKENPDLPGSKSIPEHLLTRGIYKYEEEAMRRFEAAREYFLQKVE